MTELEVKGLAYEICLESHCVVSVDYNDTNRVLTGESLLDGFRADCPCDDYTAVVTEGINKILSKSGYLLVDILIYINIAEENRSSAESHVSPLVKFIHKDIATLPEQTRVTLGYGTSKDIQPGYFRLIVIAGYENISYNCF